METSTGVWLTGDTSLESLALNPREGGRVGFVLVSLDTDLFRVTFMLYT